MPGEILVCVWQLENVASEQKKKNRLSKIFDDVKAKFISEKAEGINRSVLKLALDKLQDIPVVEYNPSDFESFFAGNDVIQFQKFKEFVVRHMCEDEDNFWIVQEQIETKCWQEVKDSLIAALANFNCSPENIRKLWYIFNRLASERFHPVTVKADIVDWLSYKLNSRLETSQRLASSKVESYGFVAFVENVFERSLGMVSPKTAASCIEYIYNWMVTERMESGWIHKRTRQNANWTDWSKKWAVLSPSGLSMFKDESEKTTEKQQLLFSSNTTLSLGTEKSTETEYPNRFKIQNLPHSEVEISAVSHQAWLRWTQDTRIILAEAKTKHTPVQSMLKDMFTTLNQSEKVEILSQKLKHSVNLALSLMQTKSPVSTISAMESNQNMEPVNLSQTTDDQMRAVFMKVDTGGNGKVEFNEFHEFMKSLGLAIDNKTVKGVFEVIDINHNGTLSYDEFADYFADILSNKDNGGALETELRQAFLKADRDGSGAVNFKEVSDWLLQSQQSICKEKVLAAFKNGNGEISLDEFKALCTSVDNDKATTLKEKDSTSMNRMEQKLMDFYSETDGDELTQFIQDRWKGFAAFRREGASGEVVMTGGDEIVKDFVPGNYSLIDMVCFSDLPPLEPDFTVVKGAVWKSSKVPGKSGKLICPKEFNGQIRISPATSEFLRYYGCSFAEGKSVTVSLMYRHAVQDFTYESAYLSDYVKNKNGGSGIEKHDFVHLDCPMEEDNGHFILGKFVSETELHLTAFQVPIRHTLYLPANTIHSNDYLKGTWRTLLSDESAIDHVHLTKYTGDSGKALENFTFKFVD